MEVIIHSYLVRESHYNQQAAPCQRLTSTAISCLQSSGKLSRLQEAILPVGISRERSARGPPHSTESRSWTAQEALEVQGKLDVKTSVLSVTSPGEYRCSS